MLETLPENLPSPPGKYDIDLLNRFCKDLYITTKFELKPTTEDAVLNLLKALKLPGHEVLTIFLEDV